MLENVVSDQEEDDQGNDKDESCVWSELRYLHVDQLCDVRSPADVVVVACMANVFCCCSYIEVHHGVQIYAQNYWMESVSGRLHARR